MFIAGIAIGLAVGISITLLLTIPSSRRLYKANNELIEMNKTLVDQNDDLSGRISIYRNIGKVP